MPLFNFNQNGQVVIPLPMPIENGGTGAEDAATARTKLGINLSNFLDTSSNQSAGGNKTFTGPINFTNITPSTSTTTGALVIAGGLGVGGNLFVGGKIAPTISPDLDWGIDFTTGGSTISLASGATYDLATGSGMVVIYDLIGGHFNFLFASAGGVISVALNGGTVVAGSPAAGQVGLYYNPGTAKYRVLNNKPDTRTLIISSIKMRPTS